MLRFRPDPGHFSRRLEIALFDGFTVLSGRQAGPEPRMNSHEFPGETVASSGRNPQELAHIKRGKLRDGRGESAMMDA